MADLSKFKINGVDYDLKDPTARQNSGVGGNTVYYMDLAAEYPKPDSEIYFNSVTLSALSNNGAGIKIGDIIVASNGTLCKVTSVSDTTVGYDAIGTITGDGNTSDSGGKADFVVQDTPPEDTSVLWVDPTDNSDDGFQEAVNTALAQAKASGEFKGEPGEKGEPGDDYVLTDADKEEIAGMVEVPEGSGGGIAVTGAKVGQTVKIAEVDENGVPTAWESVEFPSGAEWRLIADITLEEEVTSVDISTDMDGKPIELSAYYLIAKIVPAVNTADRFTYIKINVNNKASMNNINYDATTKNQVYLSDLCILAGNVNPIHFTAVADVSYNWNYSARSMSPYYTMGKMNSINLITINPNDYSKVFGGAGTEIKLYGIDI